MSNSRGLRKYNELAATEETQCRFICVIVSFSATSGKDGGRRSRNKLLPFFGYLLCINDMFLICMGSVHNWNKNIHSFIHKGLEKTYRWIASFDFLNIWCYFQSLTADVYHYQGVNINLIVIQSTLHWFMPFITLGLP